MKVYLDSCCYNRPYDSPSSERISAETQAKLSVQDRIQRHELELASSFMLRYEISQSPNRTAKRRILEFVDLYADDFADFDVLPKVRDNIDQIMSTGIKFKDACHVAYAIFMNCDFFLSTDKRLLKYRSDQIEMLNPIEFIKIIEERTI